MKTTTAVNHITVNIELKYHLKYEHTKKFHQHVL